jgi:hypothetical protein
MNIIAWTSIARTSGTGRWLFCMLCQHALTSVTVPVAWPCQQTSRWVSCSTCQLLTSVMSELCCQHLVSLLLQCQWCPAANRCSSGMDRHRQDWLYKGCDKSALSNATQCPAAPAPTNTSFTPQVSEDGGQMHGVAQTDHIQSTGEHSTVRGEWPISVLSTCCLPI